MPVPMMDLKAQYATLKAEIDAAVGAVMASQHFRGGEVVAAFERDLAAYAGVRHAIGVATGTDALLLSFRALDLRPGDDIVTTPFTFFATAGAIVNAGARPVFADIEPRTFNLDPKLAEMAITPRTRAIVPVHLFGQCADMDAFLAIGRKHGIPIIEDTAQSLGARYHGRPAGSMGLCAGTSFYPTKNLGGAGEGGAILTQDDGFADRIRLLRSHGSPSTYEHLLVGTNSHLHTLQAAVLHVKLPHLDAWNARRREIAQRYHAAFAQLPGLVCPHTAPGNEHVWHQYVIRIEERDRAIALLTSRGIAYGVFYPKPLHQQPCFSQTVPAGLRLPEAERAATEVLALPIYPEMSDAQQEEVIGAIREHCAGL